MHLSSQIKITAILWNTRFAVVHIHSLNDRYYLLFRVHSLLNLLLDDYMRKKFHVMIAAYL